MRWLAYQSNVPPDWYRVSLALIHRAKTIVDVGLTPQELSRLSGMSVLIVEEAIAHFRTFPDPPLITLRKHKGAYRLTLNPIYVDATPVIAFTFDDTDQKRIATLENALQRADVGIHYSDRSALTRAIRSEDEASFIEEVEKTLGRGLGLTDAYFLGKLMGGYGLDRVRSLFRQQKKAQNPLQVVYAMLSRGARGQKWTAEAPKPIHYGEL